MRTTLLLALILALCFAWATAAPMPSPVQRRSPLPDVRAASPAATPQPRALASDASADEVFEFYKPVARWANDRIAAGEDVNPHDEELTYAVVGARDAMKKRLEEEQQKKNKRTGAPTPIKRSDVPSVPLSQLGPPSFPAQYPSWSVMTCACISYRCHLLTCDIFTAIIVSKSIHP